MLGHAWAIVSTPAIRVCSLTCQFASSDGEIRERKLLHCQSCPQRRESLPAAEPVPSCCGTLHTVTDTVHRKEMTHKKQRRCLQLFADDAVLPSKAISRGKFASSTLSGEPGTTRGKTLYPRRAIMRSALRLQGLLVLFSSAGILF